MAYNNYPSTPGSDKLPESPQIQKNADGTPSYYQRDNPPPYQQPTSSGATGGAGVGGEADQMDLTYQTIDYERQRCRVKGRFICQNEELYALESDKPLTGYDGLCPKCRKIHVVFDRPTHGFYASTKNIHDKLLKEQLAQERSKGRKDIEKLPRIEDKLPPLDHPIVGKYKGIEGDSNSCYMDATIFCMFAYSNVFDSLLHMNMDGKPSIKNLQKLLRENIVNILRNDKGFVERDALFHLRAVLSEATGDQSFKEMEKDPSEFLRALEGLFHYAPLKTIRPDQPPNDTQSNITTNIIWEMFDANPNKLPVTNIATIFRNSLSEIPAKLATIPPVLVLVAPRHTRSQRSYRYIIPDRNITLDNKIVQLVCLKCKKTNHDSEPARDFYSCDGCFSKESSLLTTSTTDAMVACYCTDCLSKSHKIFRDELPNHNTKRISIEKHKLNLFAVLCIETSHYIAFVKCRNQNQQSQWLFFDSMSDRIYDEKNVPLVNHVPDFDRWIDEAENDKYFFENLDSRRNQARPISQTFDENGMRQLRLFRDGAFYFYENSSVNYQ